MIAAPRAVLVTETGHGSLTRRPVPLDDLLLKGAPPFTWAKAATARR
jgi:hypothetical protein